MEVSSTFTWVEEVRWVKWLSGGAVWLAVVSERPSLTCTVLHRQSVIDAANANELRQSIELRTSFVRSFVRSFDQSVWLVGVVVSSLVCVVCCMLCCCVVVLLVVGLVSFIVCVAALVIVVIVVIVDLFVDCGGV